MAFAEDLSVFFDEEGGFAVSAVLTPAGGSAQPAASVLFDMNGAAIGEFGVVTNEPALLVATSVWPSVADGDAVAITGAPAGDGAYLVRQALRVDDGALTACVLARS